MQFYSNLIFLCYELKCSCCLRKLLCLEKWMNQYIVGLVILVFKLNYKISFFFLQLPFTAIHISVDRMTYLLALQNLFQPLQTWNRTGLWSNCHSKMCFLPFLRVECLTWIMHNEACVEFDTRRLFFKLNFIFFMLSHLSAGSRKCFLHIKSDFKGWTYRQDLWHHN